MNRFSQTCLKFLLPGGALFFGLLLVIQKGYLSQWLPQINTFLPWVILGIGFLLGWRFHRSRLAFAVLLLVLAERILHFYGPGGMGPQSRQDIIYDMTCLLLPLNMTLLYFTRERGIINISSLLNLCFLLFQPVAVLYVLHKHPHSFSYLDRQLVNLPAAIRLDFPQTILLVYGVVLLLFFVFSLISEKAALRGFFWALAASAFGLFEVSDRSHMTLSFCTAGAIIILSVIETAYAMAYNDELTGLPARRALNTTLHGLGRHFTIAMLDIDFFKKFNDRYGHDVGDQVLCMVASHIRRVGGGGKPFRYGGEEFTVVFPGKTTKEAQPYLEQLRESIAGSEFRLRRRNRPKKTPKTKRKSANRKSVSVTISIGAAEPTEKAATPEAVIKAADKALYRAKKKGRNCVVA